MKLSLAWLGRYLECPQEQLDPVAIATVLNRTTCEVDASISLNLDHNRFSVARLTEYDDQVAILFCDERQQAFTLPARHEMVIGWHYLLSNEAGVVSWATMADAASEKEGLLGPCRIDDTSNASWQDTVPWRDTILVIDNKSITHRADLWSHYGMARELAALLRIPLRPVDYASLPFVTGVPRNFPLNMVIATPHCRRMSMAVINQVAIVPSSPAVVLQLARVDMKSHNAVVDATNWVMLDLGQPMHAFDQRSFAASQSLTVRQAHEQESIVLLDGSVAQLTAQDIVVSDGTNKPLSVAGIKGGKESGVVQDTTGLVIEAGSFDAGTIRKTSQRLKLRTESSVRVEKTLDPVMTELALQRFIALLQEWGCAGSVVAEGVTLGVSPITPTITLPIQQLQTVIGAPIPPNFVIQALESIGFQVTFDGNSFAVTVPSWRAQKDVTIVQDVIEEVARLWGYDNVVPQLPTREMRPFTVYKQTMVQSLKKLAAYGLQMHEVQNYPLYDEQLLAQLAWQPTAITVKNPLSSNAVRLVTSLVPHLLKNIATNMHAAPSLRFIEVNVVWPTAVWPTANDDWHEQEKIAFIWWEKNRTISFYEGKQLLATIFAALQTAVVYHPLLDPAVAQQAPWYAPYQSAVITAEDMSLGYCGMVDATVLSRVVPFGTAFVAELSMHRCHLLPECREIFLSIWL
ncbi:phenylalanine--tRNA ligase subunit beta [Candidatus Dependentiae bacterium]|nr:phenylalanine--tRNA ligase subunit beta [Candidatus Dependentiae bacterium]